MGVGNILTAAYKALSAHLEFGVEGEILTG